MALIKCPECGCDILDEVANCPFCGCTVNSDIIKNTIDNADIVQSKPLRNESSVHKYKVLGILAFVLACVCFVIALSRVNSSDYEFYKEHYDKCMDGYNDSKYSERTSGLLFKSTYRYIADEYEEMADEDMDEIWHYRGQAIILSGCGAAFIIGGCLLIKKMGR